MSILVRKKILNKKLENITLCNLVLNVSPTIKNIWWDGEYSDKEWEYKWYDGVWYNGIWKDGCWMNGVWENGEWHNGQWRGGMWHGGKWKKGHWLNGIWYNGVWLNGTWYDGEWLGGKWQHGWIYDCKREGNYDKDALWKGCCVWSTISPTEYWLGRERSVRYGKM